MFCMKCGKQLPDDALFCSACGARTDNTVRKTAATQPTRPAAQPTRPTAQPSRPAAASTPRPAATNSAAESAAVIQNATRNEKKGPNLLVLIAVFVCVYLAAFGLTRNGQSTKTPTIDNASFSSSSGESFEQILPASHLSWKGKVKTSGYAAYVKENSDGMIYLKEYGYDGDLVKEVIVTQIMPTPGWSAHDIGTFLLEADALMEELNAEHSFTSGDAMVVGDYEYVAVTVHMKDMDNKANVQAAVEEQLILVENNAELISMYQTEQSMRAAGYAKK